MWTLLVIVHILVSILLVLAVLMQTGKGGLDSSISGIASNTFGTQGASESIKKVTWGLFATFAILCILLAKINPGQKSSSSVVDKLKKEAKSTAPVQTPVAPK